MARTQLKVVDDNDAPIDPRTTVFWHISGAKVSISRERLYTASAHLGFRLYKGELCQVVDQFIHERDERYYQDTLKAYIRDSHSEPSQLEMIFNAYETFIQKNGDFTISRLPLIPESDIVRDTKLSCYKFYSDGYIRITAQAIEKLPYEKLPGLTFASKVQPRMFRNGSTGKFIEFLNLACELHLNHDYISRIIGYYSHEYNDEGLGYFVVLTEQVPDPKLGGGSGKNLFTNLFMKTGNTSLIDQSASQTELDDTIFQIWTGERIFSISDLPKDFDFTYFKNISTQGIIHKRLYKDRKAINISVSPKLIFNTNYSYTCNDGGLKRRIIPLEFTNFFTLNGGVEGYFNCWFPTGWTEEDWAGYDGFTASAIQTWLRADCKLKPKELSETGWYKQFEYTYGSTIIHIINTFWQQWTKEEYVRNSDFKTSLTTFYDDNSISKNYQPTTVRLHKALEEYGKHCDIEFKSDQTRKEMNAVFKVKTFLRKSGCVAQNDEELPF
jgi:hypothetical protein